MTAAEVVANYPGGAAVLAAAQKVTKANTAAITAAADRLNKAAADVNAYGPKVSGSVRSLDEAWQGASADQFVSYMDRFAKAGTSAGESLTKAGAALGKVASAIEDAKTFVSNRCEQVIGEIKRYVTKYPDATQEEYENAVKPMTAEAATDIENKLKETEEVLKSAAGEIKAAGNPGARFTDIPDPGSQPYVPGPGKKVEWDQTPPQQKEKRPTENNSGGGTSNSNTSGTGGGGGGGLGSSGGPPAGPVPGNVQDWIKQAMEILRANGITVSEADVPKIWAIIQHESGGNPHAINNWDSNAAKGTPSKGLMQCIDPTFNSYKLPGHSDIWNPVDNICAGVNYAISRYGSLDNVPGIKAMNSGGAYRGY